MDLERLCGELDDLLAADDARLTASYPGDRGERQPVHTVYVPADRFGAQTGGEWGAAAVRVLTEHAPTPAALGEACGLGPQLAEEVHDRVRTKLEREPIEDLRIDFEDGYGSRPDEVEDAAVVAAARTLAATIRDEGAPAAYGIRFKSLEAPTRARGLRTLALFVAELAKDGPLPSGLVVTLPKVTSPLQVEAMVLACDRLEEAHGLDRGRLRFEIQIETPQSILGADGTAAVARMIHAAQGRCTGLHYGTYDYSAACGIAAAYQSMEHPVADHAKAVMQVAAAGTGVFLSDGSTNVLPIGDAESVRAGWRLHARLVRRSLERGFYQGWDLHPAQLPSRYAATFAFYREGLRPAAARLAAYVHGESSTHLDEPATATALAGFLMRGLDCGAIDSGEVEALARIGADELARLARRRTSSA